MRCLFNCVVYLPTKLPERAVENSLPEKKIEFETIEFRSVFKYLVSFYNHKQPSISQYRITVTDLTYTREIFIYQLPKQRHLTGKSQQMCTWL